MRVLCKNEHLTKAIRLIERVVGKNPTLPILSSILLEIKGGVFSLSATNLEIGVVTKIPAKAEDGGGVAIPARILSGFAQTIGDAEDVLLEERGNSVTIRSGAQSAVIKGFDAHDFPIIPTYKKERGSMILPTQGVRRALERVVSFVSLNETRPELTGVYMSFGGGKILFAATDSFRLGEGGVEIGVSGDADTNTQQEIIIPAVACHELIRIIGQDEQTLTLTIQEKQLFFTLPSTTLVSRLIDGKYPDYKQIIPQSMVTEVVVRADDFLRSIKAASLFTQSNGGEVSLDVSVEKGQIEITSRSQEAGESSAALRASVRGEAQRIVLNPRYLIDGVGVISAPFIYIGITANAAPVIFRGSDEESGAVRTDLLYIVMPIKNQ